jgi:hypothetical protein
MLEGIYMFYYTKETINVVTENLIKRFCGDTIFLHGAIDIDGFIYDFLNYDVVYDDFATDCFGESAFLADGKCGLTVWRSGKKENVLYPSQTIVLDRHYLLPKNKCKRRFERFTIEFSRVNVLHGVSVFRKHRRGF